MAATEIVEEAVEEVAETSAEAAGETSDEAPAEGPYEERFSYDGSDKGTDQDDESYESRFAYAGKDDGEGTDKTTFHESQRLLGPEERQKREASWRQRYNGDRKILPPAMRDEGSDQETVVEAGEVVEQVAVEPVIETAAVVDAALPETGPEIIATADSDNLQQIKYISTGLEKKLNLLGVYKLSQIAKWSEDNVAHISEQLELKGRIDEEGWVEQAAKLIEAGGSEPPVSQKEGSLVSGLLSTLSELDKITDMSEHEKTMLSNNGITSLSQIANWSGKDMNWASELLGFDDLVRVSTWVSTAKGIVQGGAPLSSQPQEETTASDDDLKRIRGIDAETEASLKDMGVSSYVQIAEFEQADMDKVNEVLGTSGRVERQYWVVQAKVLRDGGETDFSKLYDGSVDS